MDIVWNSFDLGFEKIWFELVNVWNSFDLGFEKIWFELDNVWLWVSKMILYFDKIWLKLSDRRLRLLENFWLGFKNIRLKLYIY